MTIEEILKIDKTKIKDERLEKVLTGFLTDYSELEKDEIDDFIELSKEEVVKIYQKVEELFPEALAKNVPLEKVPTTTKANEGKQQRNSDKESTPKTVKKVTASSATSKEKVKSKKTDTPNGDEALEALKILGEEIKECRIRIKAFNAKKKERQPEKPTPKRHEKIRGHLIAIGNLVPDPLKENLDVLKQTEKILAKAGRAIMNAYRMNELQIKEVVGDIKEKYDQKEEKIKKDTDE